ncbi:hypothetical protein PQU92_09015 [Asticcacaulis sp. BYS171W]|uniref:Uncharacterized protein n=1 Tax=Asticcacaulis aquaticus TaxID=2984212 RepID=A0ABT5HTQ0_9CAUL|nr:hypothetical protein [Asticcacaulis aquaticus]MDC7683414.1 hypothetical protein [Asticcacaulis aquaticus]
MGNLLKAYDMVYAIIGAICLLAFVFLLMRNHTKKEGKRFWEIWFDAWDIFDPTPHRDSNEEDLKLKARRKARKPGQLADFD